MGVIDRCDIKGLIGESEVVGDLLVMYSGFTDEGGQMVDLRGTPFKDRIDLVFTAGTQTQRYYNAEIKRRGEDYPLSAFIGDGRFAQEGVFIKPKKRDSLLARRIGRNGERRTSLYIVKFADGYVCVWRIDENTHFQQCKPRYYNKVNEYPEQGKEWQSNLGLLVKDACYIFHDGHRVEVQ